MRLWMFILLGLAASTPAAAELYRCEGPDGGTVFQGEPCAGGSGDRIEVRPEFEDDGVPAEPVWTMPDPDPEPEAPEPPPQRASNTPPGVSSCPSRREIERAIRRHEVTLCMTPAQVADAEPMKNVHRREEVRVLDSGITVPQWYYSVKPDGWPTLVIFRDGRVIGMQ